MNEDKTDKKIHVYGQKFFAKWTDALAGQGLYTGVTPAGITRFSELLELAKEGRTEAGAKVEEAFLTKLRAEAKITAWSDAERKKAKRSKSDQKAAPPKPTKSIEEAKKGFDGFFG